MKNGEYGKLCVSASLRLCVEIVVPSGAACHGVHGGRGEDHRRGRALGWVFSVEGEVGHSLGRLEMNSDMVRSTVCTSLTGSPTNRDGCTLPCSS